MLAKRWAHTVSSAAAQKLWERKKSRLKLGQLKVARESEERGGHTDRLI